jgi:hypothetical protein
VNFIVQEPGFRIQELGSSGVQEFRSSGVQEFRSSGVILVKKKNLESQIY